jgi:hypothetical protein
MISPDSELRFFGRKDSAQRRALAFYFVRLRAKLAEDPQIILAHSSMAPALASVSVITDTRIAMQPRLVTTDFLINFVTAEIHPTAPKPN